MIEFLSMFQAHGIEGLVIASQFGLIFWMVRAQRNGFIKLLTKNIEVLTSVELIIKERLPR
ncbi:hypothetical protein LCGC14_1424260 [marine sediment metagenome]|uniref:Uncharacterized protein n=2 Tax=marine sediment metagenome TaxID=412755 RepID=A0A0F9JQV8_9ZZZZ